MSITLAAFGLWVKSTRLFRANARYLNARGNLLAGGISYTALISITAALVIGWTIFMLVITAAILAIGVFVMAPVLVIGIGLAAYVNSKIFQMIFKEYHLQTV